MNWETWALAGLSIISGAIGWLVAQLMAMVKDLRRDLDTLRVNLAERYPTYDRMTEIMGPIRDQLTRIEDALTHKADKP